MQKLLPVLLVCASLLSLQGCVGWGDMFEQRRSIGGAYYLERSGGNDSANVYLFAHGKSGSVAGPVIAIGWDRDFVLAKQNSQPDTWLVFDKRSGHSRVPADLVKRQQFAQKLGKFIPIVQPNQAWEHAR